MFGQTIIFIQNLSTVLQNCILELGVLIFDAFVMKKINLIKCIQGCCIIRIKGKSSIEFTYVSYFGIV